ncbi:unnamed protein product [Pocillopora meandrina]|uniref:Uncharacterized protein n=1 Tax=Pocillopora meandrina TaxID=46732 RepID=A0AAU9WU07_9CNID|nr:unnamed protein product [Pocillopora meandrina]
MYELFIFITENFLVFELANTGYLGSAIFLLKKITLFSMKTFHGGLKDLKKKPRFIKHKCHEGLVISMIDV